MEAALSPGTRRIVCASAGALMRRYASHSARALVFLGVVLGIGCSVGDEGSGISNEHSSTVDASRAALQVFLVSLTGRSVPLYTSDGAFSGMSVRVDEGARLAICQADVSEPPGPCVQEASVGHVNLELLPSSGDGACVGGELQMHATAGVVSAMSICVHANDKHMKAVDGTQHGGASKDHWPDFVLPQGTPVLTAEAREDGKTTRTHLMFEPQAYSATGEGELSRFLHLFGAQEHPSTSEEPNYPGAMPPAGRAESVTRSPDTSNATAGVNDDGDSVEFRCPGDVNEFRSFVDGFRKNANGIQKEFTATIVSYSNTSRGGDDVFEDWLVEDMEFPIMKTSDALLDANVSVEFPDDYQLGLVREFVAGEGGFREFGFERTEHCWYLVAIKDGQTRVQD